MPSCPIAPTLRALRRAVHLALHRALRSAILRPRDTRGPDDDVSCRMAATTWCASARVAARRKSAPRILALRTCGARARESVRARARARPTSQHCFKKSAAKGSEHVHGRACHGARGRARWCARLAPVAVHSARPAGAPSSNAPRCGCVRPSAVRAAAPGSRACCSSPPRGAHHMRPSRAHAPAGATSARHSSSRASATRAVRSRIASIVALPPAPRKTDLSDLCR